MSLRRMIRSNNTINNHYTLINKYIYKKTDKKMRKKTNKA